eukprot:GFYU01014604.1.p1 GENE.GFYU01014604.1~~GFYU01014604.1.p1  ORF type:complete len:314 (+),score=75.51 GFYU01014604.1:143-943(+)
MRQPPSGQMNPGNWPVMCTQSIHDTKHVARDDQHVSTVASGASDGCTDQFRPTFTAFFNEMEQLSAQVLEYLAESLQLQDPTEFVKSFDNSVGHNATTLRLLYYPPITTESKAVTNQVRAGEHTDYGAITLLMQDKSGGLQVKTRDGQWIKAPYIADSMILNIGDLLMRWTDDELVSTPHRVMSGDDSPDIKEQIDATATSAGTQTEAVVLTPERQSIAFFVHPNDDVMIQSLPRKPSHTTPQSSTKSYDPITALDYLNSRFEVTY